MIIFLSNEVLNRGMEQDLKSLAHKNYQYAKYHRQFNIPDRCSQCERICKVDAHHDDYNKSLEVRWLCRSCHRKIHSHGLQALADGNKAWRIFQGLIAIEHRAIANRWKDGWAMLNCDENLLSSNRQNDSFGAVLNAHGERHREIRRWIY